MQPITELFAFPLCLEYIRRRGRANPLRIHKACLTIYGEPHESVARRRLCPPDALESC
jgi:hypothetical protein